MSDATSPFPIKEDGRPETVSDAPERLRVALVAGSGSVATDDLYRLLRRRLLILTSIMAVGFLLGMCADILLRVCFPMPAEHVESPFEWVIAAWRALLMLAVAGTSAVVLWRRPP